MGSDEKNMQILATQGIGTFRFHSRTRNGHEICIILRSLDVRLGIESSIQKIAFYMLSDRVRLPPGTTPLDPKGRWQLFVYKRNWFV